MDYEESLMIKADWYYYFEEKMCIRDRGSSP